MPNPKTQHLAASGATASPNKAKPGKSKSAPKTGGPIMKLDSPIKAGD